MVGKNRALFIRWEAGTSSLPGEVTICRQPGIRLYDGDSKVKVQQMVFAGNSTHVVVLGL